MIMISHIWYSRHKCSACWPWHNTDRSREHGQCVRGFSVWISRMKLTHSESVISRPGIVALIFMCVIHWLQCKLCDFTMVSVMLERTQRSFKHPLGQMILMSECLRKHVWNWKQVAGGCHRTACDVRDTACWVCHKLYSNDTIYGCSISKRSITIHTHIHTLHMQGSVTHLPNRFYIFILFYRISCLSRTPYYF